MSAKYQLPYRSVVERLAESAGADGFHSVRQLPELTLDDIGAFLTHYPEAFAEAIADAEPDVSRMSVERLRNTAQPDSERYAHVGLCVIGFIRGYVRGIVLRDVQAQTARNRELDAFDRISARKEERGEVRQGGLS